VLLDFHRNDIAKYYTPAQQKPSKPTNKKDFRSEIEKQFDLIPLQFDTNLSFEDMHNAFKEK